MLMQSSVFLSDNINLALHRRSISILSMKHEYTVVSCWKSMPWCPNKHVSRLHNRKNRQQLIIQAQVAEKNCPSS